MGRFLLGFMIGAAIGVAAVVLSTPRSGSATRQSISDLIRGMLDSAQQASATRERELWSEFRTRLEKKGE